MFLAWVACVLLILYLAGLWRRPPGYPPGPSWYPIVGNLPQLKKLSKKLGGQHLALLELARQFKTNVLGLKLGKDYVVTVFSYPVIKTVLTEEEFEGRPDNFFIRLRSMGTRKGITCTDGEFWQTHRNFLLKHLRTLGFGKSPMEHLIIEELREILDTIKSSEGGVHVGKILAPSVINVLWALTAGCRIPRGDPRLQKLLDLLDKRSKAFDMSGGTLSQHPWLRFIAPERTGYNLVKHLNSELKQLLMENIREHKQTWSEGKNDDVIYSFITEMKKAKNGLRSTFTDDQLVMICLDIFIAGSQTTSNTLGFAFLMMILQPEVQEKVHACLDDTFDKKTPIEYIDRHKVPFVEAVLMEVERYCHVVPISGPRRVLRDTILDGYHIPKDTTVLISLHSIHTDPTYWGDPEVFRPERFLDKDGKILYNERLIPFGLGRRRCIGEILARQCLFMFFAGILRKYRVSLAPDTELPKKIALPGITLTPASYVAKFDKK